MNRTFERFFIVKAFILLIIALPASLFAQYGGLQNFSFLNMPADAYTCSLGGILVGSARNDAALFLNNPAQQDSLKSQQLKLNFSPLWAGSSASTVVYNRCLSEQSTGGLGLQYFNYGTFAGADASGNMEEAFKAAQFALTVGHARRINQISMGLNLKLAGSNIANYSSWAILADFGGLYRHPKVDLTLGLNIKNMGKAFNNFASGNDSAPLPFDVQIGGSFKPEHMPLRLNLTAHHLHEWNIANAQKLSTDFATGTTTEQDFSTVGKLFQHLVIGVEALVHKNVQINVGYNHLMRTELKDRNFNSLSGFSTGVLVQSSKLSLCAAVQSYQTAGALFQISATSFLR